MLAVLFSFVSVDFKRVDPERGKPAFDLHSCAEVREGEEWSAKIPLQNRLHWDWLAGLM